jgi:hypothetical protein
MRRRQNWRSWRPTSYGMRNELQLANEVALDCHTDYATKGEEFI